MRNVKGFKWCFKLEQFAAYAALAFLSPKAVVSLLRVIVSENVCFIICFTLKNKLLRQK